jgi:hypothetical protein
VRLAESLLELDVHELLDREQQVEFGDCSGTDGLHSPARRSFPRSYHSATILKLWNAPIWNSRNSKKIQTTTASKEKAKTSKEQKEN